ncbi:MAG TPA: hypothetical protein VHL09_07800, partial [Dehalococcoidia bacterium]|nr:hypothetical protein [Dehalococcoidia bacterium]
MVRASAAAERAGVRSVSIVSTGFVQQARAIAQIFGLPDLPLAEYPGVIMTDPAETFRTKVERLADQVVAGLAAPLQPAKPDREPGPREIVFTGSLDAVQDHFEAQQWTDGLPVIPPTLDRVDRFLRFTHRSPDEVIGTLRPELREATVWNVAVNGVMAIRTGRYSGRQPARLGVADRRQRPDHQRVGLKRGPGRDAGWAPGEHEPRPLPAPLPAQR